jgi:hypothetical protein
MEEIIKNYLEQRAQTDPGVAMNLQKKGKTIKKCCEYIKAQARKSATNNVAMIQDEVVYGWAVHYYDEDNLEEETKTVPEAVKVIVPKKAVEKPKPKYIQCDLFGEGGVE